MALHRSTLAAATLTGLVASVLVVGATVADAGEPTVPLSTLHGATTPTSFTLAVDVPGTTEAKLVVDGVYVGRDLTAPFEFRVDVPPGQHKLKVRAEVAGEETRTDVRFTASGDPAPAPAPAPTVRPPTVPPPTVPPTTAPVPDVPPPTVPAPTTPGPVGSGRQVVVRTADELRAAVAGARPGDVIEVAEGEYTFKPRLVAAADGTASAPITLRGTRRSVLRTKNASGDYGLHITGDHWRIEGLTVAHASKGIVLDGSVGTVIDGVEVYDIGDEGVHFRACSSDGVLRNSYVHHTGRNSPQYGEGVYVGSANSNWSKYACTDAVEGQSQGDNTERVLIEDNVFEDVTAEGADLKEGTDSGILRRNVFRRTGLSGKNSADSAVDAKGNNWLIEGNVVSGTTDAWTKDGVAYPSAFADGFQTHSVYKGYGTGNVFRGNQVLGPVPGFGIGLYPGSANVVTCDNVATGAVRGLVGDNNKPGTCRG